MYTYRVSRRHARVVTSVVTIAMISLGFLVLSRREGEALWPFLLLAGAGLLGLGWSLGQALRATTTADLEGLTIATVRRRRRLAWSEVQQITVERPFNPTGAGPQVVVAVYDSAGKRIELPQIDDRQVADPAREAEALRALWVKRRGAEWQPLPAPAESTLAPAESTLAEVTAAHHRRAETTFALVVIASMATMVAVLALLVILLLTAPAGGHGGILGLLSEPLLVLVAPVLAAVVTLGIRLAAGRNR